MIPKLRRALLSNGVLRSIVRIVPLATILLWSAGPSPCQTAAGLQSFFEEDIGLTTEQIDAIRAGHAVAKELPARTGGEVFLFGAVYIHTAPEKYVEFARDFDRLRRLPNYVALGVVGDPALLSDFDGFSFDSDDIEALKNCKPGNCQLQLPASSIDQFQRSIDWSSADANEQVNRLLQKSALERLLAYQHDGNSALGVYNDKRNPTRVPEQLRYMLSYSKALPEHLPDFYNYLLTYPDRKPANVKDTFYWAKVKFGLKPTLRVVHIVTMRGKVPSDPAFVIAEKQLYASHYFQTALDLTFGVADTPADKPPGFYLIMAMGSEQAGLTGFKGSIVRGAAVGRSVSSLEKSLTAIKRNLEEPAQH